MLQPIRHNKNHCRDSWKLSLPTSFSSSIMCTQDRQLSPRRHWVQGTNELKERVIHTQTVGSLHEPGQSASYGKIQGVSGECPSLSEAYQARTAFRGGFTTGVVKSEPSV